MPARSKHPKKVDGVQPMEHSSQNKPSLDDTFDTKVSIWKSFSSTKYAEEGRASDNLDVNLLDHPVVDSTRHSLFRDEECTLPDKQRSDSPDRSMDKAVCLEVGRPAGRINPFWALTDQNRVDVCRDVANQGVVESHMDCGDGSPRKLDKVQNTMEIDSVTRLDEVGDHSVSKRFKNSTSHLPVLSGGLSTVCGSGNSVKSPSNTTLQSSCTISKTSNGPESIRSEHQRFQICSKVVGSIGKELDSDGEKVPGTAGMHTPRYMNGTIPADEPSEVVLHLENRIGALSMQLETCRQALVSRDRTIKELCDGLEILKNEQASKIDYEFIGQCASRGLEIVDELRSIDSPRDFTEENYSLRAENMSLKNIIEELVGRVRILKDSLKGASRSSD